MFLGELDQCITKRSRNVPLDKCKNESYSIVSQLITIYFTDNDYLCLCVNYKISIHTISNSDNVVRKNLSTSYNIIDIN